ncbi:hypothetical protein B0H17DRAFT_831034, partial [Mycena rosella]
FASSVSAVVAPNTDLAAARQTAVNINKNNCYGAPIPPWKPGCSPGWYYGNP